MRKLIPIALLLGSLVGCSGANDFNYESGYRACIRHYFWRWRHEWEEQKTKYEKDEFRRNAHIQCK